MEEYPRNSMKKPTAVPDGGLSKDPEKMEQVTTGRVILKKPSLGRRFKDAFTGEDGRSVMTHVVWDVMVPAGKDMLYDAGQEAMGRLLGIESRRRGYSGGPINYSSIGSTLASRVSYNRPGFMQDPREKPRPQTALNTTHGRIQIQDIILETRAEADEVIRRLEILIEQFGRAKVADVFDLVGKTGEWTDEKFGWYSMAGARPQHTGQGYLLDLPRVTQLD